MNGRIVLISIMAIFILNSFLITAVSQNYQIENLQDTSKPLGLSPKFYFRVLVHGNVSSGKQFGLFNQTAILKFNHAQFIIIRFFPIRLDVDTRNNVTAILYGVRQKIPEGSFDFREQMILFAIVI